jgi:hypothetical protein
MRQFSAVEWSKLVNKLVRGLLRLSRFLLLLLEARGEFGNPE